MIDNYTKTPRPLRHVYVDNLVDQTKCAKCSDKPCLQSCPIDAIYLDNDDGLIKLKNTCFGVYYAVMLVHLMQFLLM